MSSEVIMNRSNEEWHFLYEQMKADRDALEEYLGFAMRCLRNAVADVRLPPNNRIAMAEYILDEYVKFLAERKK